ncbi:MAG: hypothetical protein AB7O52_01915 [Planctomycetota bacterium]
MERVALLVEKTGERLGCLLNPSNLVVRRRAGLQPRRSIGGALTGAQLTDDPLLCTGGGSTELRLDLLFDVSLTHGSTLVTTDVRDLTRPLWDLAENQLDGGDGYGSPPLVRFIWGKTWNVLGVIEAVAERLEQFSEQGAPGRSWLRLGLRRVSEPPPPPEPPDLSWLGSEGSEFDASTPAGPSLYHDVLGVPAADGELPVDGDEPVPADPGEGERLDQLASKYLGNPSAWRWLAIANQLVDPLASLAGVRLRVPAPELGREGEP